jgi:hypothetical protein
MPPGGDGGVAARVNADVGVAAVSRKKESDGSVLAVTRSVTAAAAAAAVAAAAADAAATYCCCYCCCCYCFCCCCCCCEGGDENDLPSMSSPLQAAEHRNKSGCIPLHANLSIVRRFMDNN